MFIRLKRERKISHLSGELINCNHLDEVTIAGRVVSINNSVSYSLITLDDGIGETLLALKKECEESLKINIEINSLLIATGVYNEKESNTFNIPVVNAWDINTM